MTNVLDAPINPNKQTSSQRTYSPLPCLPLVRLQGSFLQFRLQKLQYVTLLQQSRMKEAIMYARLHFGRFMQAYVNREGEGRTS